MPSSPVPAPVAEELGRLGVRWQQLALSEASSRLGLVHELVEEIAGEPVPDLGPAVVIDQLTVVVYDACTGDPGGPGEAEAAGERTAYLLERLTALRRAL